MDTSRIQLALNVDRHRGRDPLLHRPVRRRAGQAAPRLRQLRDRRPAAQAGAVRAPRRRVAAQPPRRRGRARPPTSSPPPTGSPPPASRHRMTESDRCCHAVQDKVWVDAPDVPLGGWEFYTVLADDPDQDARRRRAARAARRRRPTAGPCCGGTAGERDDDRRRCRRRGPARRLRHDVQALDGVDLDVARGHDARRARPQRRRQDHPDPGADHPACGPTAGRVRRRRVRRRRRRRARSAAASG